MLFNSFEFLLFFPLVVICYFIIPYRFRWLLLLIASYYFYMCWNAAYVVLIIASTLVGYLTAFKISQSDSAQKKKLFLIISIAFNLGVLFVFKYLNFFSSNINSLLSNLNVFYDVPVFDYLLPVGISFYTFQILSYSVDVYRGDKKPERHIGIFALYVAFFPQLVAGPIERSTRLIPQFFERKQFDYTRVKSGLLLMLWGFFKKLVIADRLAVIVSQVYNQPESYTGFPLILATIFFAFQVYTDFSAYSDIAVGAARVMGYELMENFKQPFSANSVSAFWRKWHISLSSWIQDYVYTPLVIKRRHWNRAGIVYSLIITFTLVGLWHGANWQWIVFGLMHGLVISYEMITTRLRTRISRLLPGNIYNKLCIPLTFLFVCFSFIFFRANSMTDAFYIVKNQFVGLTGQLHYAGFAELNNSLKGLFNANLPEMLLSALLIISIIVLEFRRNGDKSIPGFILAMPLWKRWVAYNVLLLLIVFFGVFNHSEFVYFQF